MYSTPSFARPSRGAACISTSSSPAAEAEPRERGGGAGGARAARAARRRRRGGLGRLGRLGHLEAELAHAREVLRASSTRLRRSPSVARELLRRAAAVHLDRHRALRRRLAHEARAVGRRCARLSPSKRTITSPSLMPAFSAGLSFSTERTRRAAGVALDVLQPDAEESRRRRRAGPRRLRSTLGAAVLVRLLRVAHDHALLHRLRLLLRRRPSPRRGRRVRVPRPERRWLRSPRRRQPNGS